MFYDKKKISKQCPRMRQMAALEDWVQNQRERVQRRFIRFKSEFVKYLKLYLWLMMVAIIATGCAQAKFIVPNDTVTQTNTQTKTIQRDSIYLHDSIYVREYIQGDTVFRDKLVEHFKDRWLTRIDTLIQNDSTTVFVPVEVVREVKVVPLFYKLCTTILIVIFLLFIIKILLKYYKNTLPFSLLKKSYL